MGTQESARRLVKRQVLKDSRNDRTRNGSIDVWRLCESMRLLYSLTIGLSSSEHVPGFCAKPEARRVAKNSSVFPCSDPNPRLLRMKGPRPLTPGLGPPRRNPGISGYPCFKRAPVGAHLKDIGYGNEANRSLRSVWFAASPSIGVRWKISSIVRRVEPWV